MFKKISLLAEALIIIVASSLLITCKKSSDDSTPAATCSDGIQNQGETSIDCGGPCTCAAAAASITAKIDGANWTASTRGNYLGGASLYLGGHSSSPNDSIYIGFSPGSYTKGVQHSAYGDLWIGGTKYANAGSNGFITVTDDANHKMSGTFNYNVGGHSVTAGTFTNLPY